MSTTTDGPARARPIPRAVDGSRAAANLAPPSKPEPEPVRPSELPPAFVERVRVGRRSSWIDGDAAIEAAAPALAMLFDEAGLALAELTSGTEAGAPASAWERLTIEARDLEGLARAWLDGLASSAARHRCMLVDLAVDRVEAPPDGALGPWRLSARVGLRSLGHRDQPVDRRLLLATLPGLVARSLGDGYWLRARLRPAGGAAPPRTETGTATDRGDLPEVIRPVAG